MRSRDIRTGLNDRKENEKDIRAARVVRPGPTGYFWVTVPGSDQELLAAVTAGRQTFAPGEEVPLGSYSGEPGTEFVIGNPAPGRGGGSRFPLVTYPPGPPAKPHDYLALFFNAGDAELIAWAYTDGAPIFFIGSIGFAPSETALHSLGPDSRVLFLEVIGGESIGVRVWETETGEVLEYDPPTGMQCSAPGWVGPQVAWVEYPLGLTTKPSTVHLVVADKTLATVGARYSLTLSFEDDEAGGPDTPSFNWLAGALVAPTSLGLTVTLNWSQDGGSLVGSRSVHMPLAGGASELRGGLVNGPGVQWSARSLLAEGSPISGGISPAARADGLEADYLALWPDLPENITNVSAGEEIAVYDTAGNLTRGIETGPVRSFAVEVLPAGVTMAGNRPDRMFALS